MKYSLPMLLILILALSGFPLQSVPALTYSAPTPTPDISSGSIVPLPPRAVARLGQGTIDNFEFSPNGKYLSIGGSIGVIVYDTSTFKPVWSAKTGRIGTLKWSSDSQFIAATAAYSEILIWNGQTGLWLYRFNEDNPTTLDWTANDKRLIAASADGVGVIWNLNAPTAPIDLERTDGGNYTDMGFSDMAGSLSPDQRLYATTYQVGGGDVFLTDSVVIIWDIVTGVQQSILHFDEWEFSGTMLWLPDSKHVLVELDQRGRTQESTEPRGITEWDVTTGKQVDTSFAVNSDYINSVDQTSSDYSFGDIFLTPKGDVAVWETVRTSDATTLESNSVTKLVDIHTGAVLYQAALWGSDCFISPDSKMVAELDEETGQVVFHEMSDGAEVRRVGGISKIAAFSPDWSTLTAWEENSPGTLTAWNVESGSKIQTLTYTSISLNGVAWSPDGANIATVDEEGTVQIWDAYSHAPIRTLNSPGEGNITPFRLEYSPDGRRLATEGEASINIWNAETGQSLAEVVLPDTSESPLLDEMAWSPDGNHIVVSNDSQQIFVIDSTTGQIQSATLPVQVKGWSGGPFGVAWSHDGTKIASGSYGGTITIRDATKLKVLSSLTYNDNFGLVPTTDDPRPSISFLEFSPDGRSLAAVISLPKLYVLAIWDLQTGKLLDTEIIPRSRLYLEPSSMVWSPDGKYLAVGLGSTGFWLGWSPSNGGSVVVFDAQTGQERATLSGHTSDVEAISFSPDSRQLASASLDGTVLIWDLTGL